MTLPVWHEHLSFLPKNPMQGNVPSYCIQTHAPYLAIFLKLDDLPPICNYDSEKVLR